MSSGTSQVQTAYSVYSLNDNAKAARMRVIEQLNKSQDWGKAKDGLWWNKDFAIRDTLDSLLEALVRSPSAL